MRSGFVLRSVFGVPRLKSSKGLKGLRFEELWELYLMIRLWYVKPYRLIFIPGFVNIKFSGYIFLNK